MINTTMKVLMVCLGNICRSPVAEGLLRKKAEEAGIDILVDSCGTSGYHDGENPDERSVENAMKNDLDISHLISRKFRQSDFDNFDRIFVMDSSNYQNLKALASNYSDMDKVDLILNQSYPNENRSVPDPYFGGKNGFQEVFDLLNDACENFIDSLK